MSRESGYEAAINLSIEKLRNVDWNTRCTALNLPLPNNTEIRFNAFGKEMELHLDDFQLLLTQSLTPAHVSERILVLHYLMCDAPIQQTGELISFRQLDGGMFYWEAFLSRSVRPLVQRIGNNISLLQENLKRFDFIPVPRGDVGACIHVFGKVYVTLIYLAGDDEFPPEAQLLFDSSIKDIFSTEDVAVLAGQMCFSLK